MIRNVIKYLLVATVTLALIFYFWGSSGNLKLKEYSNTIRYKYNTLTPGDTLSICTYNIGYLSGMTNNLAVDRGPELFETNLKRTNKLLSTIAPHIVAFQEIDFNSDRSFNVNQMDEIANSCNYNFGAMAVNWDKNYVPFPYWPPSMHFGKMLSGQAILSKFPVVENKFETLEKPESNPFYYNAFYLDRLAQITKIRINSKPVIIINVHLEAFAYETREKQGEYVLELFKSLAKEYPVLLVGDFNSTPPFAIKPYQEDITTSYFFNDSNIGAAITEESYTKNESSHFTFNSVNPYIKIDYIFYTKDKIEPIEGRVIREAGDISDHLPVLFTFKLK